MADRVQWGGGRKGECSKFLWEELDRAITQRQALEKDWRGWLQDYRAPENKGVAHFPFEGASDVTYPLVAMNVDPIWARYIQNIHAAPNLWTLTPLNERWIDIAKPLQDYLGWVDRFLLKMWNVNMRVFPEMIKLGTSVYKTHWRYERRNKVGYNEFKQRERQVELINQPVVDHVSIANFYLPPEANEINPDAQAGAQWVAERHRIRPAELRAMAKGQEPFLPSFDSAAVTEVIKHEEASLTEHEQKVKQLERVSDSLDRLSRPIEIFEVHIRFDSTGNGIEDDLVVFYHKKSNTILRSTYEPFATRPYTAIRYLRGDGFYGIGVCEQLEIWQDTMSNVLNYNIDKILLSNAPMFRADEGANILPNEPVYPGKVWFGAKDEIEPFFMVAPGSFDINALLGFLQDGAKQRTGITDLQFGSVGAVPSRTPATTIQALLQEGNTRFDMSMKDVRDALTEVGLRVLQNLQTQATDIVNNPEGEAYVQLAQRVLGSPEGEFVAQALQVPAESVELGIGVNLTATSSVSNKELLRQSNLALLQLFSQFAQPVVQLTMLAQQTMGTPVGETTAQLLGGWRELMLRVLEQFDVRNPEEIIPNVQALLAATGAITGGSQVMPLAGQQAGGAPAGVQGF
jgi:hypothetical protein